jgi:hypothetical protein
MHGNAWKLPSRVRALGSGSARRLVWQPGAAADGQSLREMFQAGREPRPTKNLLDPRFLTPSSYSVLRDLPHNLGQKLMFGFLDSGV